MRIIVKRGAVDLALQELGCMDMTRCDTLDDIRHCDHCRGLAEKAVRAAIGEVFPKAEVVVLR